MLQCRETEHQNESDYSSAIKHKNWSSFPKELLLFSKTRVNCAVGVPYLRTMPNALVLVKTQLFLRLFSATQLEVIHYVSTENESFDHVIGYDVIKLFAEVLTATVSSQLDNIETNVLCTNRLKSFRRRRNLL